MATVPLSGTNITFLSGVPFSNDYKHTRWFDTVTDQTTYFSTKTVVHSMSQANFQRIEGHNFIAVNKSIDELWGTNYVMFQNASYNSKWFYAFVTKLEYVQRNTTYVHFEIDILQTWLFDMTFKPSYVVREHCPLWNADGTPYLNTVDEGLNYGTEYDIKGVTNYHPTNGVLFLVIVSKSTLHIPSGQTNNNLITASMNGTAQPLCVYIHPFTITGSVPQVVINGTTTTLGALDFLLTTIFSQANAVGNVVSLFITDHIGADCTYTSTLNFNLGVFQTITPVDIQATMPDTSVNTVTTLFVEEMVNYSPTEITCSKKYMDFGGIYGSTLTFANITESKLLMYPYSLTVLDDYKGNRMVVKNEYIDGDSLVLDVMGSAGVSNKTAYTAKNYLTSALTSNTDKATVSLEHSLIDETPHDVSIINDLLAAFIQGNKNQLHNQLNRIAFNGIADSIGGVVNGLIGGAIGGNVAGAGMSALGVVKGLGNAALEIQGMQAKIKDIDNQPPSLAKMGSNTSFEYGNGYYGVWAVTKQIKPEYQKKLTDFWNMFGYKLNEVKIPNFHTRQNWNYVQTKSCNITGNFNHEDLQELKQVFDSGVTLWHTDDIGNYSLSNGVI